MGDITLLVDPRVLVAARRTGKGRPYKQAVLQLAAWLRAAHHLKYRQLEGQLRQICSLLDVPRDCAPDYTTLCRHLGSMAPPVLPEPNREARRADNGLVLVIDSTGARVSEARGWHQDRPYAADQRRTKYVKLHLVVDALSGAICDYDVTRAYGHGTGDAYVAPDAITRCGDWAHDYGCHVAGGIGDGAYDSKKIYERCRARGGPWVAPLPVSPARGGHPDRDRHITGVKRLGNVYYDRVGYHQRSTVEAANGALKRTVKLASTGRSFEAQATEIAWQVCFYAEHLSRAGR